MRQLNFIKCQIEDATRKLAERLKFELQNDKKVLWLVSGGSNIAVTIDILHYLQNINLSQLTIMLTDERYGPVGHADSNWYQLEQAGFKPKQATAIPTLQAGLSLQQTTDVFAKNAASAFDVADVIIGQIGMGADGHILGILPDSPAVKVNDAMAVCYETETFKRITLSPFAVAKITVAYVFAYGTAKRPQLEQLQTDNLDISQQPAQLLKQLPETYIFNDQIGENA